MAYTIVKASDIVFSVTKNGALVVLGCATTADLTVSAETIDATCAANGAWAGKISGQKSWSGSVNAVLRVFPTASQATNVSFDDIFDILDAGNPITIEYSSVNAGGSRYSGEAIVSELKFSKPEKDAVTWSANFVGAGALVRVP